MCAWGGSALNILCGGDVRWCGEVDGSLKWSGTRLRPRVNARDSRRELDFIRMRSPCSKFFHEDGNNWTVKMQLFAGLS